MSNDVLEAPGTDMAMDMAAQKEDRSPAVIELTAEEKFKIRDLETSFLKAQIEIERLQKTQKEVQDKFIPTINELTAKYGVSTADYQFDAVSLTFRKR